MKQILTIAIPTYNHHALLKKQLITLIPQITDEIKVVIIDNYSNPPIKTFLEDEGVETTLLTIIQNDKNIGGDANILKAYQIAQTDWVWVLSDNDYLSSIAIEKVLMIIKEYYNSVFINLYTKDKQNRLVKGYREFCNNACYWSTFSISHCLLNRKKFNSYFSYYKEQIKTHQPQFLTLLKYLKENNEDTCYFIDIEIFTNPQPAKWSKSAFINDTFMIYDIIDKEDLLFFKNTIGKQIIKTQLHLLVIARIYEMLSFKNYIFLLKKIIKHSPKSHLILNKPFIVSIICLFFPKLIYIFRRFKIPKDQDYSFSEGSKTLIWNY